MGELTQIQMLEGHTDRAWHVAWSPTGETLASCSGDKTVRLWTRRQPGSEEWVCSATLEEAQTRTIRCCSWSPDGRSLATASFDATTAIWEVQDGVWEQVALLEGHENEVKGVAWNPSGSLIATCSRDKSVWIWEALPGNEYECVDVKQGHSQDVKAVAWHPKGEILVSCSYDDTIKLWRESDDEWICEQTLSGPGIGHTSTVWGLSFEESGERMVSCSDDGTLRVWSCTSKDGEAWWRLLTTASGCHERTIFSVDWSRSGAIASGSGDNSISVHEEDPCSSADIDPMQKPSFTVAVRRTEAHPADVNCLRKGGVRTTAAYGIVKEGCKGLGGMALEAYCGRHAQKAALQEAYRNLPRLEEPWRRSASPSAAPRTDPPCREPHDHQHSGGTMLAGTHMRFTSAGAAARADPAIVCARQGSAGRDWGADSGKRGAQSTVGLEAALGACREKALELELRLRAAEQRIQAQALEKQQQEKRIAKKDVDRVIDKFERRRGRWSSPQRREFEDITQQLGDFQKATEQLNKHMSSAAAAERTRAIISLWPFRLESVASL
ncbi:hypothetical protein WJX75_008769 [Coccomyxa subellipsoidea]|uniref:Probable cytosolic iron-sulfur protein assembly protein CIAO1 homolog n=1 Tax=Coccomyxa subellipsoidea TaxID=248742 RepID=A0ABR2YGT9_9CHLO